MTRMTIRLLALFAASAATVATNAQPASAVGPGDEAPPLTLEALTNAPGDAEASWEALAGKTVVLEFWGTWCGPCLAAIPHLNELAESLPDDEFVFLSVTFEEVPIIERFLKRKAMQSWIGHDTDRSTVDAFGVRAWPTTFVVRNGVIVSRTWPTVLTADRLRSYAAGAADEPRPRKQAPPSDQAAEPAGTPVVEVSVRRLPPTESKGSNFRRSGDTRFEAESFTLEGLARSIWGRESDVEVDEPETRYNVKVEAPPHAVEQVQALLAASLGLRVTTETRELDGYTARAGEDGIRLAPGVADEKSGMSITHGPKRLQFTGASVPLQVVLRYAERELDAPIDDETGISDDRLFFIEVELPTEPEALRETLRREVGVALTPATVTREITVVRSSDLASE